MRVNSLDRSHHRKVEGRNITLSPKTGQEDLTITLEPDGVKLQGDGFQHSISVRGNQATISPLDGKGSTAVIPVAENGDPYADRREAPLTQTSTRSALGVASYLSGVPLNLITGEPGERVYLNLGHRPELGRRANGTLKGGRYRARAIDRSVSGTWTMTGAKGAEFQTVSDWRQSDEGTDTFTFKKSPRGPVRFGYMQPATMEMTDQDGNQVHFFRGHQMMSGNNFAEQVQGSVTSVWKSAGRPGDVAEAAKVTRYVFDAMHPKAENSSEYRSDEYTYQIEQGLKTDNKAQVWSTLEIAAKQKLTREALAERLESH